MDYSRRAYLTALGGLSVGTSGCLSAFTGGPRVGTVTCGDRTVQPAFDDELPDSSHDWPTLQHDARRTGYSPEITDSPRTCAKLCWVFELPDGDFDPADDGHAPLALAGGVSIKDGSVYVSGEAGVYSLDVRTGTRQWRTALKTRADTTPTVDTERVYVGTDTGFEVFDRMTGTRAWSRSFPDTFGESWIDGGRAVEGAALWKDSVFVGTNSGDLYALDRASGTVRWTVSVPVRDPSTTPGPNNSNSFRGGVAVNEGVVYGGSANGRLYAFDASNGDELWAFDTGAFPRSAPTLVDNTVYLTDRDKLVAVNATTGSERWRIREAPGHARTSPAVADGTLYTVLGPALESVSLVAIDIATRSVEWRVPTGARPTSPSVANGTIYMATHTQPVALDAETGDRRWTLETEAAIDTPPAVTDGAIVVADHAGVVYGVGRG